MLTIIVEILFEIVMIISPRAKSRARTSLPILTLTLMLSLFAIGAQADNSHPATAGGNIGLGTSPIFVLNSLDATISMIDPVKLTEVRRIPTGKQPHHLYLTPDEKSLIVANAVGDSLTFIDPHNGEVQRSISGVLDPYQLRFSPDMKWFVTAANRLNHVDIYRWDGKDMQLAARIPTGKTPSHLWIDSHSTVVYCTMQDSNELVAIDLKTQKLRWRLKVGNTPADVYGTPDDKTLLVALTGDDGVNVVDVSGAEPHVVSKLKTGLGAHAFHGALDKRFVYLSNRAANTISKIDLVTFKVVDEYPGPGGPDCTELSADGNLLLISSRWARKMSVLDLREKKIIRQVSVGASPHGIWTLDHAR